MTHNDKRPIIYVSDRQAEIDRIRLEAKQAEWIPAREREMSVEEACRVILGRELADAITASQGLRWAIVAAMAAATKKHDPEAIEAIRQEMKQLPA